METAAMSPVSHDEHAAPAAPKTAPTPATALTPPTSEDMDNKADDTSSELSDIELDEDEDDGSVQPDHYYDGGKIPVFKPTMDQFRSFKSYIAKIDRFGMKSGIVKVIPPPEWRESLPALDELVKTIRIRNPIKQEFMGSQGTYTQANIEKQRSYNLPEWKALTEETQNQPPARRGERRRNQKEVVRGGASVRGRQPTQPQAEGPESGAKRRPGRPRKTPPTKAADAPQVPPTPTSPDMDDTRASIEEKNDPTPAKAKRPRGRPSKGTESKSAGQKSVASRRMNNRSEAAEVVDEVAFQDFEYHLDHLDEFTAERCAELETAYWKSLTFAQPMYAADMPGSLFTDATTSWNVARLENLLDVIGTKVPGVNTAYLYMGMWKATFAWHLEDVDLYSINYIHFGAPKQWYSISQEDARRFEAAMRNVWPNDSKNCNQFLRHKTYLISPQLLQQQYGIKVNKLVHHEGEFVITYPYGYHSGYNLGYNCAESVNFATESWLDYGRIARKCDCEADSVWVDVADIERKLRGEPTPEYYEETDDDDDDELEETGDLPSPPASVAGKAKPGRKRKRDPKEKDAGKPKKKKIRIMIRKTTREPCVLCPNEAPYEPLLPTDNGRKAHRSCALYTPETWVSAENGVEVINGVTGIDRARLELKCNFCRSKRGACFQCASKKCTRAFHATCAAAAGVQIDAGPVPTFGEDGTEYFEEGYDFRCRFHRPKRAKNFDVDGLEASRLISNFAKTLNTNDLVQIQYPGGEVFGGLVVANRSSELSVLVDVLPDGDRIEVEWKWVVVLNSEDSARPKPSANAIPMPEGMNKKSVSIEFRQDGMPTMDDPFNDNQANKWAEFTNLERPPHGYAVSTIKNPFQAKIDLAQTEQLYFYLPRLSTEARCKFTDDPNGRKAIQRADFLERVKPPASKVQPAASSTAAQQKKAVATAPRPPSSNRPYEYKPRRLSEAPSQFEYAQDAARSASYTSTGPGYPMPPMRQEMSDSGRPFPDDAYYSSKTLPAAYPGEYSNYLESVRRTSGQAQQGYTPQYVSVSSQNAQRRSGDYAPYPPQQSPYAQYPQQSVAPTAQMMGNSQPGMGFTSSDVAGRGRTASLHGHPQPSPPPGLRGGFNEQYHPHLNGHGPATPASASSTHGVSTNLQRRPSIEWTPPSQLFQAHGHEQAPPHHAYQTPPQHAPRPQAQYQSMHDFQQQISQAAPSLPERYGAQERMVCEAATFKMAPMTGYNGPGPYHSPTAPTPSPLSDVNTPYASHARTAAPLPAWTMPQKQLPMPVPAPGSADRRHVNPYGPGLMQTATYPGAQGGGNETWRYT